MTTIAQIILAIALVLSIILPFGYYLIGEKNRGRYKTAIGVPKVNRNLLYCGRVFARLPHKHPVVVCFAIIDMQ